MGTLKLNSSFRKFYIIYTIDSLLHYRIVKPCLSLINKAIDGHFVVPNFAEFTSQIDSIYSSCADINDGRVCVHACVCVRVCACVCVHACVCPCDIVFDTTYPVFIASRLYPVTS